MTFASEVIDGRYKVGAVIGRGGCADVHSGIDTRLQRPVAIKLLRGGAGDEVIRDRFVAEARAAASISDPHVVAVYDSGEHKGALYMVMELLPGRTFRDEIASGPVSARRARVVIDQVLQALCASHARGVLHRDIKPDNVLLTAGGDVRVADFGIAKVIEDVERTLTGSVMGTPSYLSPERVLGEVATEASDVYGAGIVLYEMLAGAKPFSADTTAGVLHAVAFDEPASLRDLRPELDGRLVAVVERAMAKDPVARFPTAAAMQGALEASEPSRRGAAPVATARLDATRPRSRSPEQTAVAATSALTIRHRPRVAVALAALVVALFLIGGALIAFGRGGPSPATATTGSDAPSAASTSTTSPTTTTTPTTITPTTVPITQPPPATPPDKGREKGNGNGKDH